MADNYIFIGSGYILSETANPVLSSTTYYISNTTVSGCNLRYQNEDIFAVYKNGIYDPSWTIGTTTPYGVKMASCPQASYDVNATYSTDYVILKTQAPTVGTPTLSYSQDVYTAISDTMEAVNSVREYVDVIEDTKANKKQMDWITPTLLNGWVAIGGTEETPGYFKDEFGVVHLKGSIKNGTASAYIDFFVLPTKYRPALNQLFPTACSGANGSLFVANDGRVIFYTGNNTVFSLSGISFKAVN